MECDSCLVRASSTFANFTLFPRHREMHLIFDHWKSEKLWRLSDRTRSVVISPA